MMFLPPYPIEEHQGRVLLGDPVAVSYEWLLKYARELDQPLDKVVSLALHSKNAWSNWMINERTGSDMKGTPICSYFWEHIARIQDPRFERLPPGLRGRRFFP